MPKASREWLLSYAIDSKERIFDCNSGDELLEPQQSYPESAGWRTGHDRFPRRSTSAGATSIRKSGSRTPIRQPCEIMPCIGGGVTPAELIFYKVPFHPTVFLVAPLCSRSDIIGQTDSLQAGTHASGQTGYHCTRLTHLGSDGWGLLLCTVGKFTRRPLAFTQAWLMRSLAGSLSFGPCNNFLLYNIAVGPPREIDHSIWRSINDKAYFTGPFIMRISQPGASHSDPPSESYGPMGHAPGYQHLTPACQAGLRSQLFFHLINSSC